MLQGCIVPALVLSFDLIFVLKKLLEILKMFENQIFGNLDFGGLFLKHRIQLFLQYLLF